MAAIDWSQFLGSFSASELIVPILSTAVVLCAIAWTVYAVLLLLSFISGKSVADIYCDITESSYRRGRYQRELRNQRYREWKKRGNK